MRDIRQVDLKGTRVLLRVDLNVPIFNGQVIDFTRINLIKPTIKFLRESGARIVLMSHLGRPKGFEPALSLEFLVPVLSSCYGEKIAVSFGRDLNPQLAKDLKNGEILLLENLRFNAGEERNCEQFAAKLALMGDIYINDAFSCSHRKHASIVQITNFLPSYPGLALMDELQNLRKITGSSFKPVVIVIAGLKVSTKFAVMEELIKKCDHLIIAGAMANTFLSALGYNMGGSYVELDYINQAKEFYYAHQSKIVLPKDLVCLVGGSDGASSNGNVKNCGINQLSNNDNALDVGPKSVENFLSYVSKAKLLLWNGPLGYYEDTNFAHGTIAFAKGISNLTKNEKLFSIIGGGDTTAALKESGEQAFSYVSSSGGAFLEWLENPNLPGLAALGG